MKRFWSEVRILPADDGRALAVTLDDRPLRTPRKRPVAVPNAAMAAAMAAEWRAVADTVDPLAMPVTRAVNVTLDRVIEAHAEVATTVAAFGETDLLCYRAPHPPGLVTRQAEAWDPLLAWAASAYDAPLVVTEGVMFNAQDAGALARLAAAVSAHDPWELTALHDLVTLSGSLVLGLAVSAGHLAGHEAWDLSRIDEQWNIEQWGEDSEASARAALRRAELLEAERLLGLRRA